MTRIEINPAAHTVSIDGREIMDLTRKEFLILLALIKSCGAVLSRAELLVKVWDRPIGIPFDTRTVDVHVGRLRRKMGEAGKSIVTVRMVGFKLLAETTGAHTFVAPVAPSILSDRETKVIKLVADGHTTMEIGGLLGMSETTVDTHRANIMEKLDIHRIAGLVRYAVRQGLVQA